jgi:hypothetical protein
MSPHQDYTEQRLASQLQSSTFLEAAESQWLAGLCADTPASDDLAFPSSQDACHDVAPQAASAQAELARIREKNRRASHRLRQKRKASQLLK